MSGMDEQDVVLCGCMDFEFWTICDAGIRIIGYIHSDACMKRQRIKSVIRWMNAKELSKKSFVERIASFYCYNCGRTVKKGCDTFERLCRNIISRWDV